ncbi:MAG: hypothetical protein J1E42_05955 [Akkermansiaceae bacterium]|nr:hypothetical protein [Akkermansiaceae bacterium]
MMSRTQSRTITLLIILAFVLTVALGMALTTVRINDDGYIITRLPAQYELPSDFSPEDLAALNARLEKLPADSESSSVIKSCAVFSGNQLILLTTEEPSPQLYYAFGRPLRPSPRALEEVLRVHRPVTQIR